MSKEKTNVKRIHLTLAPADVTKLDDMVKRGMAKDRSDAVGMCIRNYGGSQVNDGY